MISANSVAIGLNSPVQEPVQEPIQSLDDIRQDHINTERALKVLGGYYILIAFILGATVALPVVAQFFLKAGRALEMEWVLEQALYATMAFFLFAVGKGLLKLQPGSKTPAQVVAVLMLFIFPFAVILIIHVVALICLFSKKAKFVLSDSYLEVIERIPNVPAPIDLGEPVNTALPSLDDIRQDHITTERQLKVLGSLYVIAGGLLGGFAALSILGIVFLGSGSLPSSEIMIGMGEFAVVAIFFLVVGIGLRKLNPSIKILARVITGLWLGGFILAESTVGVIATGVALFLLCSKQTKFVLSDGYLEIIELTPKAKAKTSTAMRLLICLALAVILPIVGFLIWAAVAYS